MTAFKFNKLTLIQSSTKCGLPLSKKNNEGSFLYIKILNSFGDNRISFFLRQAIHGIFSVSLYNCCTMTNPINLYLFMNVWTDVMQLKLHLLSEDKVNGSGTVGGHNHEKYVITQNNKAVKFQAD